VLLVNEVFVAHRWPALSFVNYIGYFNMWVAGGYLLRNNAFNSSAHAIYYCNFIECAIQVLIGLVVVLYTSAFIFPVFYSSTVPSIVANSVVLILCCSC